MERLPPSDLFDEGWLIPGAFDAPDEFSGTTLCFLSPASIKKSTDMPFLIWQVHTVFRIRIQYSSSSRDIPDPQPKYHASYTLQCYKMG
jgi:hypothetical protein